MKKLLPILLCAALLAGCGSSASSAASSAAESTVASESVAESTVESTIGGADGETDIVAMMPKPIPPIWTLLYPLWKRSTPSPTPVHWTTSLLRTS